MKIDLVSLIKTAMLSKNTFELGVLRLIKAEFMNFENAKNATVLTETAELNIINKMIKQRKDSIAEYTKANRQDLIDNEQSEINFLLKFLPEGPSEEEVNNYSIDVVSKGGGNMGSYIKEIKLKFPNTDGKLIADLVKKNMLQV